MKKAIHTLFRPQSWSLALMIMLVWCGLSLQNLNAQDIVMKFDAGENTTNSTKLDECTGATSDGRLFTDDGTEDSNYADPIGGARSDTVEICPKDQWHKVKVVFTEFDLAEGDSLFAFDGNLDSVRTGNPKLGIGSGSGVGVSKFNFRPNSEANGGGEAGSGWLEASCNPRCNPSGCITFVFETNGDNRKGAGWEAWVGCEERDVEIEFAAGQGLSDVRLTCADDPWASVTIPKPEVKFCGTTATLAGEAILDVEVTNQLGEVCASGVYNSGSPTVITKDFPIGVYFVVYTLQSDPTKKLETLFSVEAPALVCNDEVIIPLGEACSIGLSYDDLLENPCEPTLYLQYGMVITLGSGKTIEIASGTNPIITKQMIQDAGLDVCGGTATARITRTYFGANQPAGIDCITTVNASCDVILRFEDKSKPVISVAAGVDTIVAADTTGLAAILNATATDNCGEIPISFSVSMEETDPCFKNNGSADTTTATITFSATDDCGNTGTAEKTVTIIRPSIRQLVRVGDVSVECKDEASIPVPGIAIGQLVNGEFKPIDTLELSTTDYISGYILSAEDEEVPSTDCGSKLYRYYSLVDWCDASTGPSVVDTTFIEYTDETAPELAGGVETLDAVDVSLDAFSCTYDVNSFDKPTATDNCDDNPLVRIGAVYRIEDGTNWAVPASQWASLDCDSFKLQFIAEDGCHEQLINDTVTQIIVVKDVHAPTIVTVDAITVSVPTDEGARVELDELVASVTDNCGVETIEARRTDGGDWGDHVVITCEDVHEEVLIEIRAIDKKGNIGFSGRDIVITAEDKIPPICEDLPDESLTCKDLTTGELGASTDTDGNGEFDDSEWQPLTGDLMEVYNTRFGNPDCQDNLTCGTLTIEQEYQLITEACGALGAKRRYRANDWAPNSSNWSEQNITVSYVPDWTLEFPGDIDLTCEDSEIPDPLPSKIIVKNGSCDLWSVNISADTFEVGDGVCLKIERHYEVSNGCLPLETVPTVLTHDVNGITVTSEENGESGRFIYTQIIKLYTTEAPTVRISDDVNTCIVGVGDAVPFNEEDNTPGAAAFECDTIRTFSATATNCVGMDLHDFEWAIYKDGVELSSGEGATFNHVVETKAVYTVKFTAFDGCGNSSFETKDFEFWDCKKPTPYVLNGLAIDLGENGTVTTWAADLDQGSYDNCTDQSNLEMYISRDRLDNLEDVRAAGSNMVLDCNDEGTLVVYIYVVDEEGNWDFVETFILVQSNSYDCSGFTTDMGLVAGQIVNPNGENVEQVTVSVSGAKQESMTTGADGTFQFELSANQAYTVTPVKDMFPLNGVSTFDLVLISKHILGIAQFDSPYKYIAADVNKSGTVTAFDLVQLRQLILNITTEFSNNDSWRFVDAKHDFSTSADIPAAQNFAEFMDIDALSANMMDVDFVGVKIGDVNGNASANSLLGAEDRSTAGTLNLNVMDKLVETGETVTVDFSAADIAATQGYQFTMNFDGLNFAKLEEGVATAANFNTQLAERGIIATSWNGEASAEDVLFSITFQATTSGMLSELISVSSDITTAEAYTTDGELLDVNIEFNNTTVVENFELGQNTPNPFKGETVIGFTLPQAGTATLTVMNVQGKVLKEIKGDYAKGYNTVVLKANDLVSGVLHYQLESADNVATKKMIIIE